MLVSPRHYTLNLTGNFWVNDLLEGAPARFLTHARMPKTTFKFLCDVIRQRRLLNNSLKLDVEAKLMMFMRLCGRCLTVRELAERFQVSLNTVSETLYTVTSALMQLVPSFIQLPTTIETPRQILDDSRYFPFFEHFIGAADGTHIPIHVPEDLQGRFRSRKGTICQSVLAMCDFDGLFTYVLAGWEGQANDMAVLNDAMTNRGLRLPFGCKILVDSGYSNRPSHITPYRNVRYHLKEFDRSIRGYVTCFVVVIQYHFDIRPQTTKR